MSNFTFVSFSCSHEFVFFSLIFFFCAVIAIHCPCHTVDLYLFIVICIVLSIGAAVLNLISMFHVISNLISSVGFDVGLDRPVHLDHVLRLSLFINHHVIDYNVPRRIHYCVSFLVIVFIRFVGSFSLYPVSFSGLSSARHIRTDYHQFQWYCFLMFKFCLECCLDANLCFYLTVIVAMSFNIFSVPQRGRESVGIFYR